MSNHWTISWHLGTLHSRGKNLNFPKEFICLKSRGNKPSFGWLEKRSNKEAKSSSFAVRSIHRSHDCHSHQSKTCVFFPQIHEETKSDTKLALKTSGWTPNMLWVMRATHSGCNSKRMFNNVPLLPFSTYSTYLKESSWSQKKETTSVFSSRQRHPHFSNQRFLAEGTACKILMRCSCFSGVKLSILFWASASRIGVAGNGGGDVVSECRRYRFIRDVPRPFAMGVYTKPRPNGMTHTRELRPSKIWHGDMTWLDFLLRNFFRWIRNDSLGICLRRFHSIVSRKLDRRQWWCSECLTIVEGYRIVFKLYQNGFFIALSL